MRIDDGTAVKNRKMDSEVYKAISSAQIQANASKLIGWHFTLEYISEAASSQSLDLNPIVQACHMMQVTKHPKNEEKLQKPAAKA